MAGEETPWDRLMKLITDIAAVFAVSFQTIVIALLAVFIIVIAALMLFFRIFVPNI